MNGSSPTRHKRQLSRQYKEAPPPIGVYAIRSRVDGRVLVGASMNVDGALNRHRFELTLKGHRNKRLQQDWLAHGAENFSFEVIDRVKKRDDPAFDYAAELAAMLALWREELGADGPGGYDARTPAPLSPAT